MRRVLLYRNVLAAMKYIPDSGPILLTIEGIVPWLALRCLLELCYCFLIFKLLSGYGGWPILFQCHVFIKLRPMIHLGTDSYNIL